MFKIKFGNHKLGDDTCIFNMGSAKCCPAKLKGLCHVVNLGIKCYAEKAEIQYKHALEARNNQEILWKTMDPFSISADILKKISNRRKITRFIRFNESGDFYEQADIEKLSLVTDYIHMHRPDLIVYGYTARSDLDFSKATFLVKGSHNNAGNNGRCEVIDKLDSTPEGYILCPGDCRYCNLCKINRKYNIAFRKH